MRREFDSARAGLPGRGRGQPAERLRNVGFHLDMASYCNPLGALGWLVNVRLRHQRQPEALPACASPVPLPARTERLVSPPFGLSVVAVAHRPAD